MPGPDRTLSRVPLATVAGSEVAPAGVAATDGVAPAGVAPDVTAGGVLGAGAENPSRTGTLLTPKITSASELAQPAVPSRAAP